MWREAWFLASSTGPGPSHKERARRKKDALLRCCGSMDTCMKWSGLHHNQDYKAYRRRGRSTPSTSPMWQASARISWESAGSTVSECLQDTFHSQVGIEQSQIQTLHWRHLEWSLRDPLELWAEVHNFDVVFHFHFQSIVPSGSWKDNVSQLELTFTAACDQ